MEYTTRLKDKKFQYKMDYTTYNLKELQQIPKQRGQKGYSKLPKEELIAFIKHGDRLGVRAPDTKVPTRTLGTIRELREIAKKRGTRGYSRLGKEELTAHVSTIWKFVGKNKATFSDWLTSEIS